MKVNIILLIIFIILSIFTTYIYYNKTKKEFFKSENIVPKVKRPFVNLYDNFGNKLNVILISKPFSNDEHYEIYKKNKDKNIFIGITSYLEFPGIVTNPYENFTKNYKKYKYKEITQGWIYCFKNKEKYLPNNIPTLFASESDFTDCNICKPNTSIKKTYDFIYICLKVNEKKKLCDDWATFNKNWKLAKKCLDIFCNKYKLKGLLIGRKGCELPNGCNYMETTNILKFDKLLECYNKAKFIFIPNEIDASPRVLSEALCINLPCLVNKNILGGWKYVNENTGEFFNDEKDISHSLDILLEKINNKQYNPRDYFIKNYGIINAGKKLKEFLYENFSDKINIPKHNLDYITPEFSKKNYKTCKLVSEIHK